jgi:hypothetical protein
MTLRALLLVCLVAGSASADPFDPSKVEYIEDPYAPHVTNGTTARLGTAVGFIYGERQDVLAIGGTGAFGHRFGRLTLEAELALMQLETVDSTNTVLGDAERLGVIARFDVIRLGPHIVGPNSMVAFYVEGGAAKAWNHWYRPDANDQTDRMVPEDSSRVEGQVGFGIMLDHRLQEPISFPHRIGWFLGWRLAYAPHKSEAASICRGVVCVAAPTMPEDSYTDRSMLFQSSLSVTW